MGRLIVIGDIHGSVTKFKALLKKLQLSNSDKIVLLGDYVDRGENPKGVIDVLIRLRDKFDVTPIKGNHEQMFLDYLSAPYLNYNLFLGNGGQATLNSYGDDPVPAHHLEFLNSLQVSYETEDYFCVHAGVNPFARLDEQDEDDLLWIRKSFFSVDSDWDFGKRIIFGHTVFSAPLVHWNKIGIDTGAYRPAGHLTAVVLPDEIFIQV